MSIQPARFAFDLDLGDNPANAAFMSDTAVVAMQQEARSLGFAEGFAAGETGAQAAAAQALTAAAASLADRAGQMLAGLDAAQKAAERDAVELAATIARKLAGNLIAGQPARELEALLAECLTSLAGVPHLVVRCHPDLAERMRDIATEHAAASGFSGRLIVMGEPEIPLGDGRIEWADGGLVRDQAAIHADIDRSIAAYLSARQSAPAKSEETTP